MTEENTNFASQLPAEEANLLIDYALKVCPRAKLLAVHGQPAGGNLMLVFKAETLGIPGMIELNSTQALELTTAIGNWLAKAVKDEADAVEEVAAEPVTE